MKTIQVKYNNKEGEWLCDINFTGIHAYMVGIKIIMVDLIFEILTQRYGIVLDWDIEKYY